MPRYVIHSATESEWQTCKTHSARAARVPCRKHELKESSIFRDITLCIPLQINRRFGVAEQAKRETSVKAGFMLH
jgi:hypothetical protein